MMHSNSLLFDSEFCFWDKGNYYDKFTINYYSKGSIWPKFCWKCY